VDALFSVLCFIVHDQRCFCDFFDQRAFFSIPSHAAVSSFMLYDAFSLLSFNVTSSFVLRVNYSEGIASTCDGLQTLVICLMV